MDRDMGIFRASVVLTSSGVHDAFKTVRTTSDEKLTMYPKRHFVFIKG